jgi:hypothetical protein
MIAAHSLDDLIRSRAAELADQIRRTAAMADTEEEIRIETERQLAFIQKEAGVKLEGRHEYTVASGRVDSVYQRVIIEYKNPKNPSARIGDRSDGAGCRKVVDQIKRRFGDFGRDLRQPLESLLGVGLDGNNFVFVRYRDGKWDVQEPVEVNRHTAERFLWALFNLGTKGKPFLPEYLAGDFGSSSGPAQQGIKALYQAISSTDNPKAQTFFSQWKILFSEVCGYEVDQTSEKILRLAESYGVRERNVRTAELLFSVHTYYAIFMKLLASEIVAFFHKLPTPLQKMMQAPTSNKLKREMEELEAGSIFRHLNITNFLEGDLFAWYAGVWNAEIEALVREMVTKLDGYNPGTLSEDPTASRDLLKKLYQELFPKSVRHDLGEYYTPDWLADHVLTGVGYIGDPGKRILDPACGSGTFLVMAISRIRSWYSANRETCGMDEGGLCRKILTNVAGFDLNPLAVMAARTNYLIAVRDLIGHVDRIEIPVYLCDSIMTPSEYGDVFTGKLGQAREFKTAAARFLIPSEVATNRDDIGKYAELLERCVQNDYSAEEFLERCADEKLPTDARFLHVELFEELRRLDKANKNGVWARIIKNAFAPLFIGQVDYVVGNPPWIVWDHLPSDYRDSTKPLWERYGLFTLSGNAARHGGGKKDLSMLMLYVCADVYLRKGGLLGFVITQTLFQTKGAGDGFRRFRLGEEGESLKVVRVDDMVRFQPFEGASNWTSVIVLRKGEPTRYPVAYFRWSVTGDLPDVEIRNWESCFKQEACVAEPIDSSRPGSPWIVKPKSMKTDLSKLTGPSDYQAHAGAYTGGANGVFWVRIVKEVPGGVLVRNVSEKSKRGLRSVESTVETNLLYPLVRWSDVRRYRATPSVYVFLAQDTNTRTGIDQATMKRSYPRTFGYLKQFQTLLEKRAAYKRYQGEGAFYSMYDIGPYTVARHKVIWRRMDKQVNAAVVETIEDEYLGQRPIIPQETCVLIETNSDDEAHYLCACLNSSLVNFIVQAHSVRGGKGFGTPSMLEYLRLRRFDSSQRAHISLVKLSKQAHATAAEGGNLAGIQGRIDRAVGALWGLNDSEVLAIGAVAG